MSTSLEQNEETIVRRSEMRTLQEIDSVLLELTALGDGLVDAVKQEAQARLRAVLAQLNMQLDEQRRLRLGEPLFGGATSGAGAEVTPHKRILPGLVRGAARAGQLLGRTTTGVDAEVMPRMVYVPTGVVNLLGTPSILGETRPLATVTVRWDDGPVQGPFLNAVVSGVKRLRVEAVVEGYSAREIQTREVDATAKTASFDIMPAFLADRLATVTETQRAALHVKVSQLSNKGAAGDLVELEQTLPIWLLARHAACIFMMDPATREMRDYSYALGSWVTPNDPSVLALVSMAASQHGEGFFGRQGRTDGALESQVRQLYDTVNASGWRYVDFITTTPRVDGSFYQRVRLPREVLQLKAGNCLDGALLFASLLEAVSLAPALVMLKDHALVAWQRFDGGWSYLDTTYLGRRDFATAREVGEREAAVRSKMAEISGKVEHFRQWPLSDLRLRGIIPLE